MVYHRMTRLSRIDSKRTEKGKPLKQETVLCIEDVVVSRIIGTTGLVTIEQIDTHQLLMPQNLWFAPRASIEDRPEFRQLIPYIILRIDSSVVVYQRTTKGSEARLHGVLSLGFGGHVSLEDVVLEGSIIDVHKTLEQAAYREVREEIAMTSVSSCRRRGFIYANEDAVSKVHLGVVEIWDITTSEIDSSEIDSIEEAVTGCRLVPATELDTLKPQMEAWSRLCIPLLI